MRPIDLQHGLYYRGVCRNAETARWHAPHACFVIWRHKFGQRFLEGVDSAETARPLRDFFRVRSGPVTPTPAEWVEDSEFNLAAKAHADFLEKAYSVRK